ncbi:DUF6090 family protein [Geojedonia litorea]|uniref:DUF6090 family protein n=1 Tax=Geojedonia litorea TaxID=1268269 RepID=A0ABV9N280_9FLAO
MIKFFRTIRQNLLKEGKTAKYFKYAIGEIVLVVIGIIIALQINNWNEERKSKLKSKAYVAKIMNDLVNDTININELIEYAKADNNNIEDYFSFFNKGNIPIDQLIDSSRNTKASYLRYVPVNQTFLDMQSSGNSNLLNEEQRNALINLIAEQETFLIIIEKIISASNIQKDEKAKYLAYPNDFFKKLGRTTDYNRKEQWLIHQHEDFRNRQNLYYYVEIRGNRIKERSKNAIQILKLN